MKKVLITGASGLLGRSLVNLCMNRGWEVYGITQRSNSKITSPVNQIILNLKEFFDFGILPSRVDAVVHLAQSNHYKDFPKYADDLFGVNVASTSKLLEYARCAGATQFIYASTGGVYIPGSGKLHETSPIYNTGNLGPYFGSKICGEILVQSYAPYFTTTILRPFFIYGPGQNRTVHLPRIFEKIRSKQAVQIQGAEGISINPIHVADAAQAIVASLVKPFSAVVNIAGADILTIRQITEGFAEYLGLNPVFERLPGEPQSLVADINFMSTNLHSPSIRLLDSIFVFES